ncbi:Leucine-rich repeat serine/threonine-protein kinase 1 [Schistosoma japonicum]|nr:Leucine-rich repeat serine/threonine-protein kinase 1 [Schistosoma japonicum]KAH8857900.1 Leucine-rich repeat serine/threonine-protein kinase 1 [Schistosoma japonicum]
MKLNQSHEGVYLVERIIPCSACLAAPSYRFNNLPRKPPAASTGSHLNIIKYPHINIANNPSGRLYKSKKDNVNQISLHNRKLSKSVQLLNHTDGLRYSHLNSSTVSLSNYLLTSEETVIQGSDEIFSPNTKILKNNQNNTITEKYSSQRKMSNSSKWSWPFKLNRYERAHSVDPSNTTECNKNNDYQLDNSSTAYSYVYGISISEYIHWYIMQRSDRTLHSRELFCPMHPSVRLWAPDLRFEDISPNLIIPSDRVHLLKFLGRGAFGSVFKGFLKNSRSLMRHQKSQSLSSKNTFTTVNQNTDSDVKYIHDVAVKLCSPVPPNLSNHCINDVNFGAVKSSHDKWSSSNLCDALVLYHQEQRRWLHNPIEASLTTYQEIRSELNVLLPIKNNSLNSYQMKFNKYSHHHSFPTLSYHKSQRISNNIQERRFNQSCFSKCLQKNELHDINSNHITNNNLLICYGIIYPNPIGFLMPLVPLGNLSDYFTSVLSSCQDLLKMVNNSSSSAAEMTDTAAVTNCDDLFLSHPLHPVTMMLIVNQIANALAHLHSLNIIHRDVKSENILIWSMPSPSAAKMMMTKSLILSDFNPFQVHIVLTDYGASRFMSAIDDMYDDEGCRGYVGTPGYMAPEILEYLGEQTYDSKVDIYAMGILLCEMIQLEQPYKKSSSVFYRLAQQVIAGVRPTIPQRFLKCCPTTLINLMTYCWASDSNRRPTADQIVLLTSPWWLAPTSLLSSSSSSSTNSEGSTRYSLNRNKSMNLSEHLDYNSSFSIRYCLSSSKCLNGFSHIQSVSSIDALRVVTCATIDNNYNLWLGGYNHLHESLLHNDDKVKSMKLGLLYIMPLNNIHPISILLSSWPNSSDIWLSQYNGKLLCYTWNNTHNEISSLSSESLSCLKLRSSWLVPSLFHSKSSVVTHFLIENSHLTDSCECLVEEDESQRTCVWTYLHPDGRLDCWSAKTQNLLKTIHLTAEFEDELFTEKPSTFVFGSVRAMEWLNSSTSILLLTTHGYLIYISVMINTNDVTTSTYSKTPTEPVTSTNHSSLFATTKILSSATSLSTPSSSSSCQLFHYHGSFSENDFAFIAPLTPSTSVCQVKVTNFAKRILTISKGYLDPISCINYQASSSITTDSTSLSTDSFEIMFNNNHNDNIKNCNITKCLNQQKFYLVKLFCDNFLFS